MTTRKMAKVAAMSLLLLGAATAHAEPRPTTAAFAFATYDGLIAASKAAMMADPAVALARSGQALVISMREPAADQAVRVATARWLQGEALMRLNRVGEAAPLIDQALEAISAAQPNSSLHGRLVMSKADALATLGEMRPALAQFQKALGIFRATKDARSQAMALQNIGSLYQDAGDYRRVLLCYAEAASIYPDDPVLLVSAYNNKANALKALGRYGEAEADFRRALELSQRMQSPTLEVRILTNLASTEVLDGKLDAADAHIVRSLRLAEDDAGAREWKPFIWGVAAQAALRRGDLKEASLLLDRTFDAEDPGKTTLVYRDFHRTAARVYEGLGDLQRAASHRRALQRLDSQSVRMARR